MSKLKFNKFLCTTRIVFFLVIILACKSSYGQAGPYTYFAPYGNTVYTSPSSGNHNSQYTPMNYLSYLSSNTDGLVAEANFEAVRNHDKLLKFTTSKGVLLEVFYKKETLLLRRYHSNDTHFDYILFDPLFSVSGYTPIDAVWTVRYFFTAHFMWIEVQLNQTPLPTTTQYLSLAYFGLDYNFDAGNINMSEFLNRQNSAKIIWGSDLNSSGFKIPDRIKIYEFNYAKLSKDIQEKFSYPIQQSAKSLTSKVELEEVDKIQLTENQNTTKELTDPIKNYNQKIIIYPNPSNEYLTVNIYSERDEKVIVTIFDILGRLRYQSTEYLKKANNSIVCYYKDIGLITANREILFLKIKGQKIDTQEKIMLTTKL